MFHFFQKKTFLVDLLEGFFDIHNHILPGIDDGAKTVKDSLEMIKGFSEFGVKNFICTPHVMHDYYDNTPKSIKKAYKKLKKRLKETLIEDVSIDYSAEYMIDNNFGNILTEDKTLPLCKKYLLIEMSYLQPSLNFNHATKEIKEKNLVPIFAHPERYQYLNTDLNKYKKLKSQGLKFQLNLLSLGGYYGQDVKKAALQLLEHNLYDFLGSDAHNLRHVHSLKSIKLKERYTKNILYLIHNNRALALY